MNAVRTKSAHNAIKKREDAPKAAGNADAAAFTSQVAMEQSGGSTPNDTNELAAPDTGASGTDVPVEGYSSAVERSVHIGKVASSKLASPTVLLPLLTKSVTKRFWSKVKITTPHECWVWTAARFRASKWQYGCFHIGKRTVTASRVAFAAAYQEEPGHWSVLHSCDNPPCCNPAHLFLGTAADNARDMHQKGRAAKIAPKGSSNGYSKLTEAQVAVILERIAAGDRNTDIARDYGVHHSTISLIRTGKKWKHVKEAA